MKRPHKIPSILFVTATPTAEAGNRVMLTWIDWLTKKGWKTALACPGKGSISRHMEDRRDAAYLAIDFVHPSIRTGLNFLYKVFTLYRFIKKNHIQILHCNSESAFLMAGVAARIAKIPIVTHFRYHFSKDFYTWLFKDKRRPQGVFFVSNALCSEEEKKLDAAAPGVPRWVIPNCLPPLPENQTSGILFSTTGLKIAYIAPVQERKNQLHLFELADRLEEQGIVHEIIAAGRPKEEGYWQQCRMQINGKQKNNPIRFAGHVEDVFSLLAESDVVISLSRYESFGISNLEAMLMGKPVVYYDIPAVREVVSTAGTDVPLGDIKAMATILADLAANKEKLKKLGMKGKKRALEYYTPQVVMPVLEQIYQKMLLDFKERLT